MQISEKYAPLFRYVPGRCGVPESVRYILNFSGRACGKSFATACGLMDHTYVDRYDILSTRYAMTSAEISIIPEFREKMDMLGNASDFDVRRTDVCNIRTGSRILFRGIKAGSGTQTARLKSIPDLKIWANDESEELRSEPTFNTIDESIRTVGTYNQVWLSGNSAEVQHWIYQRFYIGRNIPYDYNGIDGDVCYIHTTWKDNRANLSDSYIRKILNLADRDPDAYRHRFLGEWLIRKEGLIYRGWEQAQPEDYPHGLPQWYGVDWGYSDYPNAAVRMCYDPLSGTLWLWELPVLGKLTRDAAATIIQDAHDRGVSPSECEVYCDPARPENIAELRTIYDLSACKGINRDKTGRIHYLQGFRVKYVGGHIKSESDTYSWKPDPLNDGLYTDVPQDGGDHYMDAISYGSTRLRLMGVNGE